MPQIISKTIFKSSLNVMFRTKLSNIQKKVLSIQVKNENIRMLGTFPKAFSQTATSQGYSPKCAISQAATSQRLG